MNICDGGDGGSHQQHTGAEVPSAEATDTQQCGGTWKWTTSGSQQYHGQSERTDTEGFQVDKQQSGNGSEHYEHSPEAWSVPCDSRKRDGCDRKPWKAFPVSKERYRTCEDRNLGNEYSLPCFPYNVGDSRNSGSSSRLCSPME